MARRTSLQRHERHRSAPERTEVPPRSPMGTLTLRRALLASASVRLHRLEDRFLASPTPGSDRRHRPCDRPHTRPDRDRARGRTDRRRAARRHAHQHRSTPRCLGAPAGRAQRSRRSKPHLQRPAAARRWPRLARIGSARSIGAEEDDSRRQQRVDPVGNRRPLRRERQLDRGREPASPTPAASSPASGWSSPVPTPLPRATLRGRRPGADHRRRNRERRECMS